MKVQQRRALTLAGGAELPLTAVHAWPFAARSSKLHSPVAGIAQQIKSWLICAVLLVFASTYGFSFERGISNTVIGAAGQGVGTAESSESGIVGLQKNAAYLLALILILPSVRSIWAEYKRNLLVTGLLLWALASVIWSDDKKASLYTSARMVVDVSFALYLCVRYSKNDLLMVLLLTGAVAAAGCLVLALVFPQYGLMGRDTFYAFGAWQGIFGTKNLCGRMMTLLLLPAFFVRLDGRAAKLGRIAYVTCFLFIIALSRSAGSWLLCAACVAFVGAMHLLLRLKRLDALSLSLTALGLCAGTLAAIVANPGLFLDFLGKDPTLTGRTGLWSLIGQAIAKRPLTGYGYFAFWEGLKGESINIILPGHWLSLSYAENGVLELWLELGAIAVALYGMIYLLSARQAWFCLRRSPSPIAMWYASVLFYVAFENLWAGNLLTASNLESALPFIAFAGLTREVQHVRLHRTA